MCLGKSFVIYTGDRMTLCFVVGNRSQCACRSQQCLNYDLPATGDGDMQKDLHKDATDTFTRYPQASPGSGITRTLCWICAVTGRYSPAARGSPQRLDLYRHGHLSTGWTSVVSLDFLLAGLIPSSPDAPGLDLCYHCKVSTGWIFTLILRHTFAGSLLPPSRPHRLGRYPLRLGRYHLLPKWAYRLDLYPHTKPQHSLHLHSHLPASLARDHFRLCGAFVVGIYTLAARCSGVWRPLAQTA